MERQSTADYLQSTEKPVDATMEPMKTDNEIDFEMTRSFLSDAISNLSSCIQVIDTKVSIIMAAITAIIAVIVVPDNSSLANIYLNLSKVSILKYLYLTLIIILFVGIVGVIVFGVLAIRINAPKVKQDTEWYFSQKKSRRSNNSNKTDKANNDKKDKENAPDGTKWNKLDNYTNDILTLKRKEIIKTMATELWKLNSINERKITNYQWQLRWFIVSVVAFIIIALIIVFS